jgi:hypothetical protein
MTPTTTWARYLATVERISDTASPGISMADLRYRANIARPSSVRAPTVAPKVAPFGYPPMKASGNTTSSAPSAVASTSSVSKRRSDSGRSNRLGAA